MSPKPLGKGETRAIRQLMLTCMKQSASSLSALLNEPVRLRVGEVREADMAGLAEGTSPEGDEELLGVYIYGDGDLHPELLLTLTAADARELAGRLLHRKEARLTSLGTSSVAEAGNIVAGAFLSRLNRETGLHVDASVANTAKDVMRILLQPSLVRLGARTDSALVVTGRLLLPRGEAGATLHLMLDPADAREILRRARRTP